VHVNLTEAREKGHTGEDTDLMCFSPEIMNCRWSSVACAEAQISAVLAEHAGRVDSAIFSLVDGSVKHVRVPFKMEQLFWWLDSQKLL